jgi:hypothetical protein
MRRWSYASMTAALFVASVAGAQQPEQDLKKATPKPKATEELAKEIVLLPQVEQFRDAKASEYDAIVHSVLGQGVVLGVPIEASREEDLVKIGFRRVATPAEIDDRTIHAGYVYQYRSAWEEAVVKDIKPGMKVKVEFRLTENGDSFVMKLRPVR